jgi:hypothetical protein
MAAIRPGTGFIAARAVRHYGGPYARSPMVDRALIRADGDERLLG